MNEEFGERLRTLRVKKGLSQEELSELLGVSRATVSRWESKATFPDLVTFTKICECFDCSADFLLGNEVADLKPDNLRIERSSVGGTEAESEGTEHSAVDSTNTVRNAGHSLLPWILLLLLIGAMLTLYVCSRNIPSMRWIRGEQTILHELEDGTMETETGIMEYAIEVTEFFPFLRTYHLRIVFAALIVLLIIDVIYLYKNKRKKPEFSFSRKRE